MPNRAKMSWTDREAREALTRYEGLVRTMAKRLRPAASYGQALDEDDLCAEGRVAVLEALSSYEGFGIEEKTWVRTRIRQRMIDAVRKLDLRSRDEMRLVVRQSAGEAEGEEQERGRVVAARRLVSVDASRPDGEPMINRMRNSLVPGVDEMVDDAEQRHRLREALKILPERQRQALELSLDRGMALREIGDLMGISESRVCQLQKRAIEHLKNALAPAPIPSHAPPAAA
ncbi:MAG: sigma-70 family RNA polymerase sigma factor [Polyangiales bacterium]